ncbi:MAG: hypothetical protein WCD83_05745, partial [Pseudolabrys sp.]
MDLAEKEEARCPSQNFCNAQNFCEFPNREKSFKNLELLSTGRFDQEVRNVQTFEPFRLLAPASAGSTS